MTNIGLLILLSKCFKLKNCKIIEKNLSGIKSIRTFLNWRKGKPMTMRMTNPCKPADQVEEVFEIRLQRSYP